MIFKLKLKLLKSNIFSYYTAGFHQIQQNRQLIPWICNDLSQVRLIKSTCDHKLFALLRFSYNIGKTETIKLEMRKFSTMI